MERQQLLELLIRLAYEKRKVVLSSGRESDFYIDTKQASLTAEGHYLVGRLVLAEIREHFSAAQAVGGMTMGADPIASAVSLTSFLERPPGMPFTCQAVELLMALVHDAERVLVEAEPDVQIVLLDPQVLVAATCALAT